MDLPKLGASVAFPTQKALAKNLLGRMGPCSLCQRELFWCSGVSCFRFRNAVVRIVALVGFVRR